MRLVHVAPVLLSVFITVACSSSDDQSQVQGGSAASGNSANGQGGGLIVGGPGGSAASSNGGGSGDLPPGEVCATSAADGEPIPVDLYFMVDITGSMNCPVPDQGPCDTDPGPPDSGDSRWTVVSKALKAFLADPKNQGLGVGVRFFPSRNNYCSANSYTRPTVEIGPLSMTGKPIADAIDDVEPGGYTPTVPSITAAIQHASTWAKANPTHRVAVVYATDGYPKGCNGAGNTIEAAAAVAKAGFDAQVSIPTYVLGVGPNLEDLNQIAESGSAGKTKAFLVNTMQDAAAQLTAALGSIRTSAVLDCTYTVPAPPAGQTLNPNLVNVNYTNSKGEVTKVKQDPAGTACSAGSGWQYNANNTEINLCGSLCEAVKADPGGKLQVLFGCETQVGEPPK